RDRRRHRKADAHHRDRRRSPAGGTGRGEHPAASKARSVQAEGRPLHGRAPEEEGRKDRSEGMKIKTKNDRRVRIQLRQRKRIAGSKERPRLSIFRSVTHIYAQVIDDMTGQTLVQASTVEPAVKGTFGKGASGGNIKGAEAIGKTIAERSIEKGIKRVVFDRS